MKSKVILVLVVVSLVSETLQTPWEAPIVRGEYNIGVGGGGYEGGPGGGDGGGHGGDGCEHGGAGCEHGGTGCQHGGTGCEHGGGHGGENDPCSRCCSCEQQDDSTLICRYEVTTCHTCDYTPCYEWLSKSVGNASAPLGTEVSSAPLGTEVSTEKPAGIEEMSAGVSGPGNMQPMFTSGTVDNGTYLPPESNEA